MLTTVCGTGCSWFAAWSPVARKALPHASGKPCSGTRGNLLSWPRTGVPPLLRAEAAGLDSQMGRPSGKTSTTRRKVRQPLADARTRPLPMHCSRTDSVCPFHCCRLLSRGEFRVRRLSVVQAKRACLDALVMCGAWIAAVVERVENARSIAIASLTGTLGRPRTGPGWLRVTCMGTWGPTGELTTLMYTVLGAVCCRKPQVKSLKWSRKRSPAYKLGSFCPVCVEHHWNTTSAKGVPHVGTPVLFQLFHTLTLRLRGNVQE